MIQGQNETTIIITFPNAGNANISEQHHESYFKRTGSFVMN